MRFVTNITESLTTFHISSLMIFNLISWFLSPGPEIMQPTSWVYWCTADWLVKSVALVSKHLAHSCNTCVFVFFICLVVLAKKKIQMNWQVFLENLWHLIKIHFARLFFQGPLSCWNNLKPTKSDITFNRIVIFYLSLILDYL